MRTTRAASPVRLVAQREIRLRVRSKAFKIATLLLVLVTVGGGLLARSLNTDAETRYTVVVVGAVPAGFSAALSANADQLGVEIVTTTAPDQAAATAEVSSGAADAALVLGGSQPVLVWETDQIATLQAAVVNALQVAQIQQQVAALGLSSAQVSQLLAPPQVDEQILEPPDPDRGVRTVTGYTVAFVLTFILNLYGSYILLGVVEEKSTSVVEVLLAHVAPRQLLAGKVLGLGAGGPGPGAGAGGGRRDRAGAVGGVAAGRGDLVAADGAGVVPAGLRLVRHGVRGGRFAGEPPGGRPERLAAHRRARSSSCTSPWGP